MADREKNAAPETDAEKLELLMGKALDYLLQWLETQTPDSGHFKRSPVLFDIPGTRNVAFLEVQHHTTAPPAERSASVGVLRDGTDRMYSNFLMRGTKAEILEYLRAGERKAMLESSVMRLSRNVDKYWREEDGD